MAIPSSSQNQLRIIRRSLSKVQRSVDRIAAELRQAEANAKSSSNGKRKLHLSPERRRALQVHGQYLGRIRLLKPLQKARVKNVKAAKGYRAAIALAKRLGKG